MEEGASGIFVCFVVGIAFSLIPSSIVSRLVSEKEKGLYHMQIVSGIDRFAYYGSFAVMDLVNCYIPCFLTIFLLQLFEINLPGVWVTILIYPIAVIPYTYATSFIFGKETTA